MNDLIKYESVNELKADLTPMEHDPAKSKQSQARFERFAKLVSQSSFHDESSLPDKALVDSDLVNGARS